MRRLIIKKKEIEELKHKKTFVPQAMKNIKEAFAYVAEAYSSGRVHSTIKQRRSDVANDLKNVVGSAKNAYGTSVEYVKGKFNSAGNKLKNVYGTLVEYTKGALNSVGSSLYSRIYGTKVSSLAERFKRYAEDGSELSMQELTRLDCLDLAVSSSEQTEDRDVFYDAESGDAKDTEAPSPANEPAKLDDVAVSNLSDKNSKKEENGQGWFAWSLGKAKSVMTEVVVVGADVTKPYFAKITKALAPNLNM